MLPVANVLCLVLNATVYPLSYQKIQQLTGKQKKQRRLILV